MLWIKKQTDRLKKKILPTPIDIVGMGNKNIQKKPKITERATQMESQSVSLGQEREKTAAHSIRQAALDDRTTSLWILQATASLS